MRIAINGKGMAVSEYLGGVAVKRVSKLERYFRPDTDVQVMLSMLRGRHVAEITIPFGGVVLRAEEATGDMYASIDNACKKIEKQILRHRTRLEKRLHESAFRESQEPVFLGAADMDGVYESEPVIVRTKKFAIKPMLPEEAALQMDMLGHEFFVFSNADTSQVNVIYKRRDGNLGLIEPEY